MYLLHHLCRCFGLGLGPRACRRLLQSVAKLTGGTTEYLDDEERLQPKVSGTAALPPNGENMNCRTIIRVILFGVKYIQLHICL